MVLQTSTAIWTHMLTTLEIITAQPNLGSFMSVFVSEQQCNRSAMAHSQSKEDWGRSRQQNNDMGEAQREAVLYSEECLAALRKANKQHRG